MYPADTDRAIYALTVAVDTLRETIKVAGGVEAMILLPLIAQTQTSLTTLQQLKSALKSP